MNDNPPDLRDMLEPASLVLPMTLMKSLDAQFQASQAISLKRIADALCGTGEQP